MKTPSELYAIDDSGCPVSGSLFTAAFKVMLPAFAAGAEEIQIRCRLGESGEEVDYSYLHDGVRVSLGLPQLPKWERGRDVTVRLRILAGLSILSTAPPQSGQIRVRYGGRELPLALSVSVTGAAETMTLRPLWRSGQPDSGANALPAEQRT